ncbi:MAG: PH domain-containing protein [Candidatus Dormibacteria bacterium]
MSAAPDLPWQRLHPLSPVIQMVRGAAAFVLVLALPYLSSSHNRATGDYLELAVIGVAALGGVISWLVTRWRIQEGTLRVETGLVRRRHTQIPLQRIQSVDVVRPALARLLGLAEVRIRTGVAHHGDARLAYIPEERADRLRADLLLWSRGAVAAPADSKAVPLAAVRARRLLLSVWLDGTVPLSLLLATAFAVAATVHAGGARAPLVGAGAGWMLLGLVGIGGRLNSQLGYEVLEEPDGLTVRGGLIGTVVETIPRNRIQAVRMIAPLLWRPLGWVRLEVDVAGGQRRQREDRGAAGQMRTLLPVATRREAEALLAAVGPEVAPPLSPAPRRARATAPL